MIDDVLCPDVADGYYWMRDSYVNSATDEVIMGYWQIVMVYTASSRYPSGGKQKHVKGFTYDDKLDHRYKTAVFVKIEPPGQ